MCLGGKPLVIFVDEVRICSSSRLQLAAYAAGSVPTWDCGLGPRVLAGCSKEHEPELLMLAQILPFVLLPGQTTHHPLP